MFGLGLLCFFVLFASFTKHASHCETEKPPHNNDFARMLHEKGIPSLAGGMLVRTRGATFQLTDDECRTFFSALPSSVIHLLAISGSAHVLYLGRAKGDSETVYPIFNIVCAGTSGPVIDTTPFSPSAPSVVEIVRKYDAITDAQETQ